MNTNFFKKTKKTDLDIKIKKILALSKNLEKSQNFLTKPKSKIKALKSKKNQEKKMNIKLPTFTQIRKSRTVISVLVSLLCALILLAIPTGYEDAIQFKDAVKCRVKILQCDNSRFIDTGLIRTGQQICEVKFLSGKFKGETAWGWNLLNGSMSTDKIFKEGDVAQALVHWDYVGGSKLSDGKIVKNNNPKEHNGDDFNIISVSLIDYYRLHAELILALAFAAFLIIFSGGTGVRSVMSFVLTVLCLWKIIVPLYLKGVDPIMTGLIGTAFLTIVIIALVYGFDKRLFAAGGGAMLGVIFSAILSIICTKTFHIHGAVMSHSEGLLYSGYQHLSLTQIFMSSVCIGASGSIMDLAVDITSAVNEVVKNAPQISKWNAVKSGMAVARAAMGTMTTTLLLAYSGTCITLLMTFMAQGTPIYNILNNNVVAAEIITTIAGSFGLAATAPFTALLAGFILTNKTNK